MSCRPLNRLAMVLMAGTQVETVGDCDVERDAADC